jgi:preprotein translocase subunit SecD
MSSAVAEPPSSSIGGSYVVLAPDAATLRFRTISDVGARILIAFRAQNPTIGSLPDATQTENAFIIHLAHREDTERAEAVIRSLDSNDHVAIGDVSARDGWIAVELAASEVRRQATEVRNQLMEVIRRRLDRSDAGNVSIRPHGDSDVVVSASGFATPELLRQAIGGQSTLSLNLVDDARSPSGPGDLPAGESIALPFEGVLKVVGPPLLTQDRFQRATAGRDQNAQFVVILRLDASGARTFCDASRANINQRIAILLNGKVPSAPLVREPICGGLLQVAGDFSARDGADISGLINSALVRFAGVLDQGAGAGPSN